MVESSDITRSCEEALQMLRIFRNRYSKSEYPIKIYMNILYTLLPLRELWPEIQNSFSKKRFKSFEEASNHFAYLYMNKQREEINPRLEEYTKITSSVGSLDLNPVLIAVSKAIEGDNKNTEEVEYTYVYTTVVKLLIVYWVGIVLLGFNKNDALKELIGLLPQSGINSLYDIMGYLGTFTGKHLTNVYRPLPNFW